jgi:hypothetical protein
VHTAAAAGAVPAAGAGDTAPRRSSRAAALLNCQPQHATPTPVSRRAQTAAAVSAADKAMQKLKRSIRHSHRRAAAAEVAALSGPPPVWHINRLIDFRFSHQQARWAAATGLPARPDEFKVGCDESAETWWESVDALGGYHDQWVQAFMVKHKADICEQAPSVAQQTPRRSQQADSPLEPACPSAPAALKRSRRHDGAASLVSKRHRARPNASAAAAVPAVGVAAFAPTAAAAAAVDLATAVAAAPAVEVDAAAAAVPAAVSFPRAGDLPALTPPAVHVTDGPSGAASGGAPLSRRLSSAATVRLAMEAAPSAAPARRASDLTAALASPLHARHHRMPAQVRRQMSAAL